LSNIVSEIVENVKTGKDDKTVELVKGALQENVSPEVILNNGLIKGMLEVGDLFQKNKAFIPDMLIASRAMKRGTEVVKPYLKKDEVRSIGKIIVGTVKGDLHDIGKNLVSIMYESIGFKVIDLGVDVNTKKFIKAIGKYNPNAISLSALLTTTMNNQAETLKEIKYKFKDKIKVLVGGAPVTKEWADSINADGYAPDAFGAAKVAKLVIGK